MSSPPPHPCGIQTQTSGIARRFNQQSLDVVVKRWPQHEKGDDAYVLIWSAKSNDQRRKPRSHAAC